MSLKALSGVSAVASPPITALPLNTGACCPTSKPIITPFINL